MTRVDFVTAENMSVEDSSKIAVWGTVADAHYHDNVTYITHAIAQYTILLYRSNLSTPPPLLTAQS